ncbi:MAG: methyltransferase [Deltaproteobacteria bacterium]|nr:tRNA1(Val) (adenine(37)-N6)-methyltransferase [Deltaproteobacteria bacterium]RLA91048.1 MAG: methyltransferase [Deltaproteobacteria bacterium]
MNQLHDDERINHPYNGCLTVIQKKEGYRYSIDAFLLASFVKIRKNERIIELGTGCGIISLLLALKEKRARIVAVEIQKNLFELAKKNVQINKLDNIIDLLNIDLRDLPTIFPPDSFDLVISNPPYRKLNSGRINPDPEKAIARHELFVSVSDITKIAKYLLKKRGKVFFIFPAIRFSAISKAMVENSIIPSRLRSVHSYKDENATLILIEGRKEGGEGMVIQPPLIIYNKKREYSSEMKKIYSFYNIKEKEI